MRKQAVLFHMIGALAVLMFAAGCSSIEVATTPAIGAPTLPPTDPASVQVLQGPPSQQFTELGQVTLEADTDTANAQIEAKLQQGAAKLGANAVFITEDRTQAVGADVLGGPLAGGELAPEVGRVIRAKAVRLEQ
jgi:hypothetical protein